MGTIQLDFIRKTGYYISFAVSVCSGYFSGRSVFCMTQASISSAIAALSFLNRELSGEYTVYDGDSNDYIRICFKKYGRLQISGQLGGSYNEEYLVSSFESDQTGLTALIESMRKLAVRG